MRRILKDYLVDILTAIEEIMEWTSGMTFEEFVRDRKTINAVIRSLEVMGEAAKKVPEDFGRSIPRCHGGEWQECGTS